MIKIQKRDEISNSIFSWCGKRTPPTESNVMTAVPASRSVWYLTKSKRTASSFALWLGLNNKAAFEICRISKPKWRMAHLPSTWTEPRISKGGLRSLRAWTSVYSRPGRAGRMGCLLKRHPLVKHQSFLLSHYPSRHE